MSPLLEQFLSEARDFLQGIGEKLMQLEKAPADADLMSELFRYVHTLKGNSGLFDFPEMTRVLHAGEDLMDAVRSGHVAYSQELADRLLDAMDFVGMLCDAVEAEGSIGAAHAADSARLAESLRQLMVYRRRRRRGLSSGTARRAGARRRGTGPDHEPAVGLDSGSAAQGSWLPRARRPAALLADLPPGGRMLLQWRRSVLSGASHTRRAVGWHRRPRPWPQLAEMDAYRCVLDFHLLTTATRPELDEYYRYMAEEIRIEPVSLLALMPPGERQ
jgi:two-component system chemotaxis sensor kinase CheA